MYIMADMITAETYLCGMQWKGTMKDPISSCRRAITPPLCPRLTAAPSAPMATIFSCQFTHAGPRLAKAFLAEA